MGFLCGLDILKPCSHHWSSCIQSKEKFRIVCNIVDTSAVAAFAFSTYSTLKVLCYCAGVSLPLLALSANCTFGLTLATPVQRPSFDEWKPSWINCGNTGLDCLFFFKVLLSHLYSPTRRSSKVHVGKSSHKRISLIPSFHSNPLGLTKKVNTEEQDEVGCRGLESGELAQISWKSICM